MTDFVDRLATHGPALAIVGAGGLELSYAALSARVDAMCERLGASSGRLVVIEAENEVEPLIAYLAALRSRNPVMLTPPGREDLRAALLSNFQPEWFYAKDDEGWQLVSNVDTSQSGLVLHPALGALLCTSGSTGAAKFVRLSHANLDANARSIVEYLEIDSTDCAATTLPFHYCYGLSVVHSHLMSGATLMLTNASVIDAEFSQDCLEHHVTSFAGVPYTFELMDRIRFEDRDVGALRYITQAGGRLSAEQVTRYDEIGRRAGWKLFVMYGQTEATARMSYVPPAELASHPGSIGVAIPGGEFQLLDDQGGAIEEAGIPGELVYRGPNVMMGYAESRADLIVGPELSELRTGDIAERDEDGFYKIVGRSKRFIKIFGLRVDLDEVERKLSAEGFRSVVTGTDEMLIVATLDAGMRQAIRERVSEWCRIPAAVVIVQASEDYPLLASGKIDYSAIQSAARPLAEPTRLSTSGHDVRAIMREGTGSDEIGPESTFVNLGGDSLSYIRVSLALEELIGFVPDGWESRPISELETLKPRKRRWNQIETSILLRAVAIILIVCSHFDVPLFGPVGVEYPGGAAMLLLVVAGFNFAKFQMPRAIVDGAGPILRSIWRVMLPTVLFLLTVQLVSGKFNWSTILMYSNFIGPNVNFGIEPWFIYVLLQILVIVAVVFTVPSMRSLAASSTYSFALALLVLTTLTAMAGPFLWDTAALLNRTPHMLMYGFMLGCCISLGEALWQKLFHSGLLVGFLVLAAEYYTWVVLVGGLALIWVHHLWLVWPLNRVAGALGAASLFIYLSHHNFRQYAVRIFDVESLLMEVSAGMLGGIAIWLAWDKGAAIVAAWSRRYRV